MQYHSFASSHIGLRRKVNEDSFCILPQNKLWIVADGMGGHAAGDVASSLACSNLCELIPAGWQPDEAINQVHQLIKQAGEEDRNQYQMGTTLVMAKADIQGMDIYWVGDSRAYLLRSQGMVQLTKDHSLVQKMIDNHLINEQEAKHHPKRNVISQCLGAANLNRLDIGKTRLDPQAGDRILLCSDGLHGELDAKQIEFILQSAYCAQHAVEQLIEQANLHGGSDNITAIVIFAE